MYVCLKVCKQMTGVELLLLYCNIWNHLIVYKNELSLLKSVINKIRLQIPNV